MKDERRRRAEREEWVTVGSGTFSKQSLDTLLQGTCDRLADLILSKTMTAWIGLLLETSDHWSVGPKSAIRRFGILEHHKTKFRKFQPKSGSCLFSKTQMTKNWSRKTNSFENSSTLYLSRICGTNSSSSFLNCQQWENGWAMCAKRTQKLQNGLNFSSAPNAHKYRRRRQDFWKIHSKKKFPCIYSVEIF